MTEHSQEATGRLAERRRGLGRRMIRRQSALLSALGIVALGLTLLSSVPSNASTTVRPASSILLQSRFLNRNSAKCLGVLRGDMTNGTPAVQWTCDGSANQQWVRFSDAGDGTFNTIRNGANLSKCLGVLGGSTANGASLVIWDCDGSVNQQWSVDVLAPRDPNPCKQDIVNGSPTATTKVVGVLGGSTADGAQAVLWDLVLGDTDQQWCS